MPSKKVHSSNLANTKTAPLDDISIRVGQWVTVYDPILKPPPDLMENLEQAKEMGENVHLYLTPNEGIDSLKGKIFKVRSVMIPYVLCSLHNAQGDPISIAPFDLRRVSLCPVSTHYRRKMQDIYDDIRGFQMARAGYTLSPEGDLLPPQQHRETLTSPLSPEEAEILNLLNLPPVSTDPTRRPPDDRPDTNPPGDPSRAHPPT